MTDTALLSLHFETPETESDEEALLEAVKALLGDTIVEFPPLVRSCDVCKDEVPMRARGLRRDCSLCGIKYDVCEACQAFELGLDDVCPLGWGCGE